VEIADVEAALAKVRAFITLLEQNHNAWKASSSMEGPNPHQTQTDNQIQEQLPLIIRIAARADDDLAAKMEKDGGAYSWSYYRIEEASLTTRRSA
jgi:hypothetical protein